MSRVTVKMKDIIAFLEGMSTNTDTDPYWLAASELRRTKWSDITEWILPGKPEPPAQKEKEQ